MTEHYPTSTTTIAHTCKDSADGHVYYRSHPTEPMHQAKISLCGEWSGIFATKRAAEIGAITTFLRQRGEEAEVMRVNVRLYGFSCLYSDTLSRLNRTEESSVFWWKMN